MTNSNVNLLSTGSKGNCIILNNDIMLDCGISYKKVKPYLKNIKIIYYSHQHQDHLNKRTLKHIADDYPAIKFIVSKYLVENLLECGVLKKNIYVLEENKWYDLGYFKARIEPLVHDIPNYLLKLDIGGYKAIYIIDTANVDNIEAKNYDLYLIEANYDEKTIDKHIEEKDKNFEYNYMFRVLETHLSYQQAMNFLIANMDNNSEYMLIHQSDYNYESEE